jgi:hypothetical protein
VGRGTGRDWRDTHEQEHGGRRHPKAHTQRAVDHLGEPTGERERGDHQHTDPWLFYTI